MYCSVLYNKLKNREPKVVIEFRKALKAYIDQKPRIDIQEASNGQTYKIPLKGKIQVVEKEQALKDSASGRYIYGLQMQMRQE